MAKHKNEELADELAWAPALERAPEAPASVKTAAPAPADVRTPRAWAESLGHIVRGDPRLPQSQTFPDMVHAVADKLHGWTQHEHHYQAAPLKLTRADYEAALDKACNQTTKVAVPHRAALSPASPIARAEAAAKAKGSV
jgi:hypothetical protein